MTVEHLFGDLWQRPGLAIEERSLRSYEGGWADLARERTARERVAPAPAPAPAVTKPRTRPPRREHRQPSELERLEQTIASTEARVAELEAKLASDWTNMDVLAAHRAAR